MTVLILTTEEDVTADMVVVHLNACAVPVVRLDPADLTGGAALSGEYVHGAFRGHLSSGGGWWASTACVRYGCADRGHRRPVRRARRPG